MKEENYKEQPQYNVYILIELAIGVYMKEKKTYSKGIIV